MDENQDPNQQGEPIEPAGDSEAAHDAAPSDPPTEQPAAFEEPLAGAKAGWRGRTFRWRAVAAVAVAGVILGATAGSVTTALVGDDRDHGRFERGEHHRIEMRFQQGTPPMLPPDGVGEDGFDEGTDG